MTNTEKEAKLQEMMSRMDWRDREKLQQARGQLKPNLDHDLFVVSLHLPVGGQARQRRAVQYRMAEMVEPENPAQLMLAEENEEAG
jgi:hypothetical protein